MKVQKLQDLSWFVYIKTDIFKSIFIIEFTYHVVVSAML